MYLLKEFNILPSRILERKERLQAHFEAISATQGR
jgi:hypothetical protein